MANSQLDPARLQGEALQYWFRRSPQEVERERQAAEHQRFRDFFNTPAWNDGATGFVARSGPTVGDIDPGLTKPLSGPMRDIDPGFEWAPIRPNSRALSGFGGGGADQLSVPTSTQRAEEYSASGFEPNGGKRQRPKSERRPLATNGAASRNRPRLAGSSEAGTKLSAGTYPGQALPQPSFISSLFGGPVPLLTPAGNVVAYYDHQAAKAGLDITAQYAGVAPLFHPAGWLDAALAESGTAVASLIPRTAGTPSAGEALNLLGREVSQAKAAVQEYADALTAPAKNAIRRAGRNRFAQASGKSAKEMGAQVHHSDPLEFAHLNAKADPNRFANLWALPFEAHQIASNEWAAFSRALKGRMPSPAELMAAKLRIDRLVAPYVRRAGVSRPGPRPK